MNEKQIPLTQPANPALVARSKLLLIASWIMLAVSFSIASLASTLTTQFETVFSSFGAELPALTLIFLKGRMVAVPRYRPVHCNLHYTQTALYQKHAKQSCLRTSSAMRGVNHHHFIRFVRDVPTHLQSRHGWLTP